MEKAVILIEDDEPTNISVLGRLLKDTYRVRACKSSEQALAALDMEPRPDLVLLDVMMPGMDGYAVLERVRANPKNRDIPVLFVTALTDDIDEEKGLRLGAADVFDALISPRVYKAPWSFDAAAEYVMRSGGTHFDPDIVAAFDTELGTFGEIYRRASDAGREERP